MIRDGYSRPEIDAPVLLDAAGAPIPYGERWSDGPPEESYSRISHPERFAPLAQVARALADHLRPRVDLEVSEETGPVPAAPGVSLRDLAALGMPVEDEEAEAHLVRLRLRSPGAVPLTFAIATGPVPGVTVLAGATVARPFPSCACDACDETGESADEDLEDTVFALVESGLTESVEEERPRGLRRLRAVARREPEYTVFSRWGTDMGEESSSGLWPFGAESARAAQARLAEVGGHWDPWEPSTESGGAESGGAQRG